MLEILFLLAFTLHNVEEALWLPQWSRYAARFHKEVARNEFHFALIVITMLGYLITFLYLYFPCSIVRFTYLGFVLMMCLNSVFPHLIATVVLRRYAPGTITGLFLFLPVGSALITGAVHGSGEWPYLAGAGAAVSAVTILFLKPLFALGRHLVKDY